MIEDSSKTGPYWQEQVRCENKDCNWSGLRSECKIVSETYWDNGFEHETCPVCGGSTEDVAEVAATETTTREEEL